MIQRTGWRIPSGAVAAMFCFVELCLAFCTTAQTRLPVGTWRTHISYHHIHMVEVTPENVFAANESGIMVYHRAEQNLTTYSKLNGLSSTGITYLRYDEANDQLLVAYDDGGLDILKGNTVTSFDRLRTAPVTGAKKINHISVNGNLAYLSTGYGIVVFDLTQLEIKETWRDLGIGGSTLTVNQSTFYQDSIFLATANGVVAGSLNDNLLDYNNWKRTGNFPGGVRSIVSFNNTLYATGSIGVYHYADGQWIANSFLQNEVVRALTSSPENLIMITASNIRTLNANGQLSQITDELITSPSIAVQDATGTFWIGDTNNGLLSDISGTYTSYVPNGPSIQDAFRLVYDNEKIWALAGGFASGNALQRAGNVDVFDNGTWTTVQYPFTDITGTAFNNNRRFFSTFGSGIAVVDASENTTMLDENNSPLLNAVPENSNIPDIENATDGLWVLNYAGNESLHLLQNDGRWSSFSFNFPNAKNPTGLAVDHRGNIWMALDPATGGGLLAFEPEGHGTYYKTNVAGNGALPDQHVRSVVTDREGLVWIGTDAGVAYFFSTRADATKPIFENRFLLRDEQVSAIEVDGGNRKWIGTNQGAWLVNPTGETLVHHFTIDNSPLLSNVIRDIAINDRTGEVYFATDKGIVSYQGDAITAGKSFDIIKVFPNPVPPGFSGTVGISGLANDALVKITDISGNLIWQTQANGGMATWNVRGYDGRRAATGIYLIFAVTPDGTESMVGKIAVIE